MQTYAESSIGDPVLIDETGWLIAQTERHLPKARAFVRPAFDEPDQVRALDAL